MTSARNPAADRPGPAFSSRREPPDNPLAPHPRQLADFPDAAARLFDVCDRLGLVTFAAEHHVDLWLAENPDRESGDAVDVMIGALEWAVAVHHAEVAIAAADATVDKD